MDDHLGNDLRTTLYLGLHDLLSVAENLSLFVSTGTIHCPWSAPYTCGYMMMQVRVGVTGIQCCGTPITTTAVW